MVKVPGICKVHDLNLFDIFQHITKKLGDYRIDTVYKVAVSVKDGKKRRLKKVKVACWSSGCDCCGPYQDYVK